MTGILKRLFDSFDEQTDNSEQADMDACNVTGHNWKMKKSSYYTSGVPGFGREDKFSVYRTDLYTCIKCDSLDKEKTDIAEIHVDTEENELTVEYIDNE